MKQTNGINKSDVVTIISNKTSIKKNDVDRILSCFFETVTSELSRGHYVKITGFGVFENAVYKQRKFYSPLKKDVLELPDKVVPKFRASKAVKEKVKKKMSNTTS